MFTSKRIDVTGQSFGRWTVTGVDRERTTKETYFFCRCSCPAGTVKSVRLSALTGGASKSCGCLTKEAVSANMKTHGMSHSLEYNTWVAMKQRCLNPNHEAYEEYGGRGITICARWADSFEAFLEDMGKRPSRGHSLDRIDGSKGYEPGNCRWATGIEQNGNRKNARLITAFGETKPLDAWARDERCKVSNFGLSQRLKKGWDAERAMTTPPRW